MRPKVLQFCLPSTQIFQRTILLLLLLLLLSPPSLPLSFGLHIEMETVFISHSTTILKPLAGYYSLSFGAKL